MTGEPWLLVAPPWAAPNGEPALPDSPRTRKRRADMISAAEIELGKLAQATGEAMKRFGWQQLVTARRGLSNIAADVKHLPHKAARLLEHLRRRGAAVPMATPPWDTWQSAAAIQRGPHQSSDGEREFVATEMLALCAQGYWVVLPFDIARQLQHLRISPLGVVPQRDQRPRLIVDYTFSGVNAETVPLAPREAMQFGRALQRVCTTVVKANPRYGPVAMAKIDIADGFYLVGLRIEDIPKLGVTLPTLPGSVPLVAFPLALPMGWVESPPYFTALTETACDLANAQLRRPAARMPPPHRLETVTSTPSTDDVAHVPPADAPNNIARLQRKRPAADVDVYVDDFLLLAQTQHQRQAVTRAALHSIDDVFRPLAPDDPPFRTEPSSVKKMLKGDACWSTRKRLLGWDVDSVQMTLNLPPHRLERLREVLQWIQPPRKRLAASKWHKLLGELRSMAPALPGTRGLFSVLQNALSRGDGHRVHLNHRVHDVAADFTELVDALAARPTRLQERVPMTPSHVGAADACRHGMGGVWLDADGTAPPIVWRQSFPPRVAADLVTFEHPKGPISISDLELTALIAQKDVLVHASDVRERTLWRASDNRRAAVSWSQKGSSTSIAARAYLLQFNALHFRKHRYLARHHYIPGPVNAMADDASRRWDLSPEALLTHFDTHYPQARSWQLHHLSSATNASLIGALYRKRPHAGYLANVVELPIPRGSCGNASAPACKLPPSLFASATMSPSSSSSPNATAPAPSPPAATLSALGQWRMPYERWARRMPGWGPLTLA